MMIINTAHSFSKYFNICCEAGGFLDAGHTAVNKIESLSSRIFHSVVGDRETVGCESQKKNSGGVRRRGVLGMGGQEGHAKKSTTEQRPEGGEGRVRRRAAERPLPVERNCGVEALRPCSRKSRGPAGPGGVSR